ncbi:MAG: hypothetical protein JWN34_4855 [Bryobacterales bacterium]|nr:hypothetical protein [Bryobacterales bacterium]
MAPWILFLFAGAFDWGFYSYALISVQSAARVAVANASLSTADSSDAARACSYVLSELQGQLNVGLALTTCNALPVTVTLTSLTGPDLAPAVKVTVTYQTVQLVPIPGVLAGRFTLVRSAVMRIRG